MFTTSDRVRIARYLGYSPAISMGMIQTVTAQVESLGEEYVEEVQRVIHELDKIQEQLNDSRLGAGQSFRSGGGGTAQYFRGDRMSELKSHGRQHVGLLSQLLNLITERDVFAAVQSTTGRLVRG